MRMTGRKPKIIQDKKQRGEWAESVFMARAGEQGLAVSRPWGDSNSYDCVVGTPGKFVAVQVKSTIARSKNGRGYICSTCSSHKSYRTGAFDFVAAYVVLEDAWYIVPAKEIRGMKSISLCAQGGEGRYEKYREAWHLLHEASALGNGEENCADEISAVKNVSQLPSSALERMEAAMNIFRQRLEGGGVQARKRGEEI
jgi:PD-(D/E)XK endonuclease